ncbi:manganese efflux pump MntP family protein [Nocardioides sp.]|uniref:manganese efflux pump MntP n=1 Tax=Nocardioides sp. TaxID=35761 RepID=UPI00272788A7|nr:manganese efflux pump MntP family protein [Nocardioides sp.]MDO9457114.1 manganese efflux pump MntP family protein [Nocardioides sp.]
MSLTTLFLIALGVSADAFAVALGKGLTTRRLRPGYAVALALTFGLFQAGMPVLGWLLGIGLRDYVTEVDHWIAFVLLGLIGVNMIREALSDDEDEEGDDGRIPLRELLVLGVATSIDALAVGITLAFVDVSIVGAAALIGVVTFALSLVGVYLGHRAGARFRGPAEVVGGLILIGIGTKILLDHLGVL